MVYNRGGRPRNGGSVRDAREVLRNKGGRKSIGARGPAVGGASTSKRIIKTSHGLVTNKKPKGISTSQLSNRQREQKIRLPVTSNRVNSRPVPRSGDNLTATLRRSAIINSSPVLQSILCYLMPMDSTVGARADVGDGQDATIEMADGPAVLPAQPTLPTKTPRAPQQDLNRNEAADAPFSDRHDEFARLERSLEEANFEARPEQDRETNQNELPPPTATEEESSKDVVITIDQPSDPLAHSDGSLRSKEDSEGTYDDTESDIDDFELPKTCVVLKAPNGSLVYVVGSAHFSRESQEDVRRVIRSVKPGRVVVELCKQRVHTLTLDENILLRESSKISIATIREAIAKMGTLQGGMYILLMQMSAHITSTLKIAPGGEFRVAFQEANRLENCEIFLGDRQINITLKRAWANLGVWQRISIIATLLFSNEDISAEDVEKCKEKDILEQLIDEMGISHPDLTRVLIGERDRYLCRSLYDVAMSSPIPTSVVAVVGIGHQKGIIDHWNKAHDIDLQELIVIPQPSLSVRVTNKALYFGMWVGIGFIAYKFTPRSLREAVVKGVGYGVSLGTRKLGSLLK